MAHRIQCPCQMACGQENVKGSSWKHLTKNSTLSEQGSVPARAPHPPAAQTSSTLSTPALCAHREGDSKAL